MDKGCYTNTYDQQSNRKSNKDKKECNHIYKPTIKYKRIELTTKVDKIP
jgi:hypothetical protein